jgi:predicted dehydrogenase
MSNMLKVVIVGCGGISHGWFKATTELADVSIVGIVDLFEASALKRQEEFQLTDAKIGTDVEAMLREVKPDIVFDCTVPEARATVVRAGLRAGCHVMSEKPMAASMAEANDMVAESKKAGRMFAIMQNRRYIPHIRGLRSFLEEGSIGNISTLNSDFYIGAHFGGFRDKMKHVLLLDMAIHSFDQARLISGADAVAVYCHEWNPAGSWYDHDASAICIFEMTDGIVYTYRGSWCAEGLSTSWECDWRIVGTQGTATWANNTQLHAQKIGEGTGFMKPLTDMPIAVSEMPINGHAACIHNFIDCVRTGRIPETICTENIKSLAMVFGAIESAETGKRVSIKI